MKVIREWDGNPTLRAWTLEHEDGRQGVYAVEKTWDLDYGVWVDGEILCTPKAAAKAVRRFLAARERAGMRKRYRVMLGLDAPAEEPEPRSDGSPYR